MGVCKAGHRTVRLQESVDCLVLKRLVLMCLPWFLADTIRILDVRVLQGRPIPRRNFVSTAPNMAAPILLRVPRAYRWLQIGSVIALIVALLVLIFMG